VADDAASAYTELLERLWTLHPQLAGYLRMLGRGPLVIPIANWTEVHDRPIGVEQAERARAAFIAFLAARCTRAVEAGVTGWQATEAEIAAAIHEYIEARVDFARRRNRQHPYPRHSDFVGACEEAVVSFAFGRAGLKLGYISHEILRRWTQVLGVANFSYYVPDAPALRIWGTADIDDTLGFRVQRRSTADWGDRVIDALPDAYERAHSAPQIIPAGMSVSQSLLIQSFGSLPSTSGFKSRASAPVVSASVPLPCMELCSNVFPVAPA